VEECLEVASACQWGFFAVPGTSGVELPQPGTEHGEFDVALLLVDLER
jgi:hypothetical protein